jgi:hypothetical protein
MRGVARPLACAALVACAAACSHSATAPPPKATAVVPAPVGVGGVPVCAPEQAGRPPGPTQAMRGIAAHAADMKRCYGAALRADRHFSARLIFNWTVGTDGTVRGLCLARSSVDPAAEIARCLDAKIRTWRWDPPPPAEMEVTYPFVFNAN